MADLYCSDFLFELYANRVARAKDAAVTEFGPITYPALSRCQAMMSFVSVSHSYHIISVVLTVRVV